MIKPCQPVVIVTDGEFRVGLCDCFADCGLCFKSCVLPCLTFKSTHATFPAGTEL